MNEVSLYTKPVDQLMIEGRINLNYYELIRPKGENWVASLWNGKRVEGTGPTPREAIINMYNKLR